MVAKPFRLDYDTPLVPEEDPNIFYPDSDDEPMAESDLQRRALIDISEALIQRYSDRPDVYVSADIFVYYEMNNPRRNVAPDVLVTFGVENRERLSYFVWREGKAPDFVLEIASPNTWRRDATEKRDIYAAIGVTEYWRFDPNRGQIARRVLVGERLNESGEYEPIPVSEAERALTAYSAVLGLDFYVRDRDLRMYDPVSQTWLRTFREEIAARRIAEEQAQAAKEQAQAAEDRAALLERILREHGITPPGGP